MACAFAAIVAGNLLVAQRDLADWMDRPNEQAEKR